MPIRNAENNAAQDWPTLIGQNLELRRTRYFGSMRKNKALRQIAWQRQLINNCWQIEDSHVYETDIWLFVR